MSGSAQKPNMSWLLAQDVKNKQVPTDSEEREKWFAGTCTGGASNNKCNRAFPIMAATAVPKEYFDETRDALRFMYDKVKDDEKRREKFQAFCEKNQKFVEIALSESPGEFSDDTTKDGKNNCS